MALDESVVAELIDALAVGEGTDLVRELVHDDTVRQVVSKAVVIATGITATGQREVLGVDIGDSEDETFWTKFCRTVGKGS